MQPLLLHSDSNECKEVADPHISRGRVSDQLSDRLIFGRLFYLVTLFLCEFAIEGTGNVHYAFSDSVTRL